MRRRVGSPNTRKKRAYSSASGRARSSVVWASGNVTAWPSVSSVFASIVPLAQFISEYSYVYYSIGPQEQQWTQGGGTKREGRTSQHVTGRIHLFLLVADSASEVTSQARGVGAYLRQKNDARATNLRLGVTPDENHTMAIRVKVSAFTHVLGFYRSFRANCAEKEAYRRSFPPFVVSYRQCCRCY